MNTALDQQSDFEGFVWDSITAATLGGYPAFTSRRLEFAAALLLAAAKVNEGWLCSISALRILRLSQKSSPQLTSFLKLHEAVNFDSLVSASIP